MFNQLTELIALILKNRLATYSNYIRSTNFLLNFQITQDQKHSKISSTPYRKAITNFIGSVKVFRV